MLQSISTHRAKSAFAVAFLLTLIVASVFGVTPISAARSTTYTADLESRGDSILCAARIQSSDYYLRQEQAVLSIVTKSNWNAAEIASLTFADSCAAGMQSSDFYLRQEESILRITTQSNWNAAEMASVNQNFSIAQANH